MPALTDNALANTDQLASFQTADAHASSKFPRATMSTERVASGPGHHLPVLHRIQTAIPMDPRIGPQRK